MSKEDEDTLAHFIRITETREERMAREMRDEARALAADLDRFAEQATMGRA